MATPTTMLQAALTRAGGFARRGDETGPTFYDRLAAADPDADKDVRKILSRVRTAGQDGRSLLERGWWQKILYVNGRQWIYPTARGWADKRQAKWIPRPVTNECLLVIKTIRSIVTRSIPEIRVMPNGDRTEDVMTASMATDLEPIISQEHKKISRWFEGDFWSAALGTQFFHTYWDMDNDKNYQFLQALACPQCGFLADPLAIQRGEILACPNDGIPTESFQPAEDQDGPIGENVRLGGGITDCVSPLEILLPSYYQRWDDVSELVRYRWRPKSWYEGRPYESQLQYSSSGGQALQLFRAMSLMTDLTTAVPGAVEGGGASQGVVEAELWIKPCEEYPDGLWCRAATGNQGEAVIIRDEERGIVPGPLPYATIQGTRLWPWTYLPYDEIGGRIWGGGALDGVIQIQDKLNRNDSMVELIMQRMANPIWLEPKGAEVQRFTGEPGLIARYNIIAGSNAKPERLEGSTPSAAHFNLREQYIDDIRRLTGTREVLQGLQQGGVDSFSGMNLLLEQAQGMFTPYLKARGRAQAELYLNQLELERKYGPDQRVKPILGARNTYSFKLFNRQLLTGSISVVVEDGSEAPKTSLGMRAAIEQGSKYNIIPFQNPATAQKVLETMGIAYIVPSLDAQTRAARVEQEQYLEWVQHGRQGGDLMNPLKVLATQDHHVHVEQLDLWANTDEIRQMMVADQQIRDEITLHRVEHLVAAQNQFGLPVPSPQVAAMSGLPAPGGPRPGATPQPGAPAAPHAGPPQPPHGAAASPPTSMPGAGRVGENAVQEANAPDTLPGFAPGGGNMAQPA